MNENNTQFTAEAQEIEEVSVENQVEEAYIEYAMSVIGGRALPDVRDGLKPVQRRVLYKMYELGVTPSSSHRKSSSIVGETMGDLHPHGDKAIYDSLVRMSQNFSLGIPLIDGQGNFGSMDGDPPAAMRYTEARMSSLGQELLNDIDEDTVDFLSNYDNRLEEPEVLPASVPNLLINGASGIAVGMTTDIPPHNLTEVIDATIFRIQNPNCKVFDAEQECLMDYIHGPDLPTGGTIVGREGIRNAYETGKGKIRVRAKYDIDYDDNQIIITEIPYQENKSRLVEKLADAAQEKIPGISDIRDESDREGVRIVIDIKDTKSELIDIIENKLINSVIEKTVSMNHIALVDGKPMRLSLDMLLDNYISHRRNVVRRRSEYNLQEKEDRLHIVIGRIKALNNIDDIVETIRNSDNNKNAVSQLESEFDLSEEQAKHITRMRLSSLTGMKQEELLEEQETLESEIEELQQLLNDSTALDEQIISELQEMKESHGHERRTNIMADYERVEDEDLIPQEESLVVLTENNYVKRMPVDEFGNQSRNGKGVYGLYTDDDSIKQIFTTNTHDRLLLFTEKGDVHDLKGYDIPSGSRQAHGTNIVNLLDVDVDEDIHTITSIPDEQEYKYLTIITEKGQIKRTDIREFDSIWQPGLNCISLPEDDTIVDVFPTTGETDIMICSKNGSIIRFNESDIRPTGRTAYGVRGIELNDNDSVASATVVTDESENLFVLTDNGQGKQTPVSDFRVQSRAGKGVYVMRDPDGSIVSIESNNNVDNETVFVSSKENKIIRIELDEISTYSRMANGLSVMSLDDEDKVQYSSVYVEK